MKRRTAFAWALAALLAATTAHADLIKIGTAQYGRYVYNLIYEGELGAPGLVWLDCSQGVGPANAATWLASLDEHLTVTLDPPYTTDIDWNSGWRLPNTVDGPWESGYDGTTTGGYNITSSEMGHLFYVTLGNLGQYDTNGDEIDWPSYGLRNTGPFEQLYRRVYYSGTRYTGSTSLERYWTFDFSTGLQSLSIGGGGGYSLAVHEGTVSVVPLPGAAVLGLIGMATAGWLKRRRALWPESRRMGFSPCG